MDTPTHPAIASMFELAGPLEEAARATIRAGYRSYKRRTRRRRGGTVRPGPATPLWNTLARLASRQFRRRGDKANLGRVLGLPRQRIHELLVARTACPDAERTLLLVAWVQLKLARRRKK